MAPKTRITVASASSVLFMPRRYLANRRPDPWGVERRSLTTCQVVSAVRTTRCAGPGGRARLPRNPCLPEHLAHASVLVPAHYDARIGRRRQARRLVAGLVLREEVADLGKLLLRPRRGELQRGAGFLHVLLVLALSVESAGEHQMGARVVSEQIERSAQSRLGVGEAAETDEDLGQVAMGSPVLGIHLERTLEPAQRARVRLAIPRDAREMQIRPGKRGLETDRLFQQLRGAGGVALTQIALAADDRELLGALADLTAVDQTDFQITLAQLLGRRRRGQPRRFGDHDLRQPHVALVGQPLPVPPDTVGVGRRRERRQPKRFELLVAAATARGLASVGAVVVRRRDEAVLLGERSRPGHVALFHDDVDLQLRDGLEAALALDDLGLLLGLAVEELPPDFPRKARDEEIEVGQRLVVGAEANQQGAHPELRARMVGRQRSRLGVRDERLVELPDVLGDRAGGSDVGSAGPASLSRPSLRSAQPMLAWVHASSGSRASARW